MGPNPYSTLFGKEPAENIHRLKEENIIVDSFTAEHPTQQIFMITGVRGSGKTVFMTDVAKRLKKEKDWIVVELSSEGDILEKLGSALTAEHTLADIFQRASINLSFFGFGLEVKNAAPITSMEVALGKMLESLQKLGKRLLVAIDEVICTSEMRAFASAFQLFVRKDLPIFLLMTGLHENIEELQNEKNLTFLYRAPKVYLPPLDIRAVSRNYQEKFSLDHEDSVRMAKMTRGYPYAFQTLGYLTWENGKQLDETVTGKLQQYLEDYVYDIIWQKLSEKDKLVAYGIAKSETGETGAVRKVVGMTVNQFNPYRKRLIKKGIVNGDTWGIVRFTLPYFEQFVISMYEGETYD